MEYSHRYSAYPTQQVAERLEYHIDVHRQAYNHTRYEYTHVDADNIGSAYKHHDRLTEWKDEHPVDKRANPKNCDDDHQESDVGERVHPRC